MARIDLALPTEPFDYSQQEPTVEHLKTSYFLSGSDVPPFRLRFLTWTDSCKHHVVWRVAVPNVIGVVILSSWSFHQRPSCFSWRRQQIWWALLSAYITARSHTWEMLLDFTPLSQLAIAGSARCSSEEQNHWANLSASRHCTAL